MSGIDDVDENLWKEIYWDYSAKNSTSSGTYNKEYLTRGIVKDLVDIAEPDREKDSVVKKLLDNGEFMKQLQEKVVVPEMMLKGEKEESLESELFFDPKDSDI